MNASQLTRGIRGLVFFLSRDAELTARIEPVLAAKNLFIEKFASLEELNARLRPSAVADVGGWESTLVLADAKVFGDPAAIGTLATDLRSRTAPPFTLVCLAPPADLRYRLALLRARAGECLDADIEPTQLADRLAMLLGAAWDEAARILVVDDQPVAALFAARVLESAGFRTEQVGDPLQVLAAAARFNPHLVLMDLHMPGASGIELTEILRGEERFADLPIIFLSSELNPNLQLDALRMGADDFLAKPILPDRLVATVHSRLELSRRNARRRADGALDPETGLMSREQLLRALDRHIRPGKNANWNLVYLEGAQKNTSISRFASEVAQRVAAEDLVARAGDHGVAVLTRRASQEDLVAFADSLGEGVRRSLGGDAAGQGGAVALGIGWCPLAASGGEAVTLVSRARKAARISLQQGKGQCVAFTRPAGAPSASERSPIVAALLAEQLQLLYQPMVALRTGVAEAYEATPRLHTADGELLPPGLFGPLALRAGLAQRVDRWMLDAGLDALKVCRTNGRRVELFIHQTMTSIGEAGWVEHLRDGIASRDLIRLRPILQFQLGDADRRLELAARRAAQLERLGIRICINGLAEGERAERVLATIPVAYVRLAAETVRTLTSARLKDLVEGIHQRGAQVIATGVDGPKTIERLYPAHVDLIQGPYIQSPSEAMDFDFKGSEATY